MRIVERIWIGHPAEMFRYKPVVYEARKRQQIALAGRAKQQARRPYGIGHGLEGQLKRGDGFPSPLRNSPHPPDRWAGGRVCRRYSPGFPGMTETNCRPPLLARKLTVPATSAKTV